MSAALKRKASDAPDGDKSAKKHRGEDEPGARKMADLTDTFVHTLYPSACPPPRKFSHNYDRLSLICPTLLLSRRPSTGERAFPSITSLPTRTSPSRSTPSSLAGGSGTVFFAFFKLDLKEKTRDYMLNTFKVLLSLNKQI